MKVTISIPDSTEKRARSAAKRSRMNFSQFMSAAADSYAKQLEESSVTHQIDAALDAAGGDDSNQVAGRAGLDTLRRAEW
ncbi:CopG family transcriptional regulator [Agromyces bauzanensis]|uniref:CopG family transcriptional regulator n=1 Tax=Agromyces bauzanensis TaxID=1308924 RepID=A0A917P8S3_9MICO|nr:CopG family transcriptional regulator [Agromyces bauzanensis]GGJ66989.1 hypothetical protein GCM10011372_00970 [Agromyces bauzanensis]